MNDLTQAGNNAPAALANIKRGLAAVRAALPASNSDPFLRLLRDGNWVFGAEDKPVARGTEVLINTFGIEHGFVCWTRYDDDPQRRGEKNKMLGESMVPLTAPPVDRSTLPNYPYPWQEQLAFTVKFLDGAHSGAQVQYKATSHGAMTAAKGLLDAIMARVDEGTEYVCPIVALDVDSYQHRQWGRTYTPILNIVSWADVNGVEDPAFAGDTQTPALAAPEPEPVREPEPAPAGRRRGAAPAAAPEPAPAAAPETGEAAPRRRRRG